MIKFGTGQEKLSSDPESVILIVTHIDTQVLYLYQEAQWFLIFHPLSLFWQWPAWRTIPGVTLSLPCCSVLWFCFSQSSCWQWNVTAADPAATQGKPFPALLDFHATPWHSARKLPNPRLVFLGSPDNTPCRLSFSSHSSGFCLFYFQISQHRKVLLLQWNGT